MYHKDQISAQRVYPFFIKLTRQENLWVLAKNTCLQNMAG